MLWNIYVILQDLNIFPLSIVITKKFHFVFSTNCVHNYVTIPPIKHWLIERVVCQIVIHHIVTSIYFFMRTHVPKVPNMIKYIFSMHLELSNQKILSLEQNIRSYVNGFPLGCSVITSHYVTMIIVT